MDIKIGTSDLQKAREILNQSLADKANRYILDFGAGFQNIDDHSYLFFLPHKEIMVTIYGDPEIIFTRHRGRSYEKFLNDEYRESRQKIYNLSTNRIDNGDIEENTQRLLGIIEKLQQAEI